MNKRTWEELLRSIMTNLVCRVVKDNSQRMDTIRSFDQIMRDQVNCKVIKDYYIECSPILTDDYTSFRLTVHIQFEDNGEYERKTVKGEL